MFKILISLCFIALAVASPVNHIDDENLKINFVTVENIEEYKRSNPSLELTPLTYEVTPFGTLRYTLGGRVGDDRLVYGSGSSGEHWPSPQDIKFEVDYPNSGVGAVVTFVQVVVNQDSNIGHAYLTGGGIGQRFISIIIEAGSIRYLDYNAEIYGY